MHSPQINQSDSGTLRVLAITIALIPFMVYVKTLNPSIIAGDAGELITASYTLGIPHNSGYPLYTLLGKLATLIPVGNIAFRINLLSTICIFVTLILLFHCINAFISNTYITIFSVYIFAFAPLIWEQAIGAEVYSLHLVFISIILWLFFLFYMGNDIRILFFWSIISGLSFSNHLQSYILVLPMVLTLIYRYKKEILNVRNNLICLSLFFFGLSIYLYLPIRSQNNPFLDWGNPENIKNFFYHVSAVEHRSARISPFEWVTFLSRSKSITRLLYEQFLVLLPFIVVGIFSLYNQRRIFMVLLLSLFLDSFYTIFLNNVPFSVTPFNLTTVFIFAITLGLGIKYASKILRIPQMTRAITFSLMLIPVIPLSRNYYSLDYKDNYILYDHGQNIFKTIPEHSFLLIMGDNAIFPLWYLTEVERNIGDILLLEKELLNAEWYWEQLSNRNAELHLFEIKPELYRKDEMSLLRLIEYLSNSYKLKPFSLFKWPEYWNTSLKIKPLGIVFQINGEIETPEIELDEKFLKLWTYYSFRGLFDGTLPLDPFTAEILGKRYSYFFFQAYKIYERIGQKQIANQYLQKALFLKKLKTPD